MWLGLCAGCSNPPVGEAAPAPSIGQPAAAAGSGSPASAAPAAGSSAAAGSKAVGSSVSATATSSATAAAGGPSSAGASGTVAAAIGGSGAAVAGAAAGQLAIAGNAAAAGGGGNLSAAGGGAFAGSAAGSSGSAGAGASDVKPPCLAKPSQLVVVGDSYLNWISHTFPDDFKKEFGGEYRMYAVGGASMASGGIAGFIPDQLTMAIADDKDIIAGVMTGGGNDILIADTSMYPGSDACKDRTDAPMQKVCQDVITNAMDTAKKLMKTAGDAGMKDVIYIFYPHIPGGGFGGMNPNAILDYSLPMARDLCAQAQSNTSGKLRCHFVDLQPVFSGHDDWFADDGIHENSLGSAAMAKEVVKLMKDKCIAQPKASGCCAP
jgi:hypothetical protein